MEYKHAPNRCSALLQAPIVVFKENLNASRRPSEHPPAPVRPFYTRIFFQELFGLEGQKNVGGKNVSYEDFFPKKTLARNSHRKKKLEYSQQPSKFLGQIIPGDMRKFFEDCFWIAI